MSGAPDGWRSGKDTEKYFADQGIEVHLSTITRQRKKYPELFQKIGRTLFIDAEALIKKYRDDYRGAIHAGETSNKRPSRLTAKPAVPDSVRAAAPKPKAKPDTPDDAAAAQPEPEADRTVVPLDPTRRKAHYEAMRLERNEYEAQGLLIPATSAHAAIAYAIAEGQGQHLRAIGPAAERIAAMFASEERSAEVKAILDDVFRGGWNGFAAAASREITDSNPEALDRFKQLEEFAHQLMSGDDLAPEAQAG
jgi:hypothetical protein